MKERSWDKVEWAELALSGVLFAGSIVGWPISCTTWAKDEPATTLSLSWLALIYAAFTAILVSLRNIRNNKKRDDAETS